MIAAQLECVGLRVDGHVSQFCAHQMNWVNCLSDIFMTTTL